MSLTQRDETFLLLFALYLMFLFLGNVTNFPAVLQPSSTCQWFKLLKVCCQLFMHQPIVFCIVRPILLWLCGQPLYFLLGLQPLFLASLSFAAHHSHACALPSLNLKKMRDCSQSRIGLIIWQPVEPNKIMKYYNRLSPPKKDKIWNKHKIIVWTYCRYVYMEFLSIMQYDDVISLGGNSINNGPHGTHKKSFKMVQFFPCMWKVFRYYKGICHL